MFWTSKTQCNDGTFEDKYNSNLTLSREYLKLILE